ncbi:L-seryl-tRNA(Sec) kinase [Gouania willdenowi]|uniref:Phosphoseryl-tRNA kinase n=1 Tax=Gouania willdenowi TaxID=441366 RepID=A0A8C5IAX8_GOUWI|nr:L-seryl-tRNA(Sec) kinase [Gouania willdenowi]
MSEEQAGAVGSSSACLCLLCGLPAAGKSALALSLRSEAEQRGWRTAVAPYDDLIPPHAFRLREAEDCEKLPEIHTEWKRHRQSVLLCIEQLLKSNEGIPEAPNINRASWQQCISDLQQQQTDGPLLFILDDNFYYPSMRYEVCQLARKYSLAFCQVYLQCDLETCIMRNRSRSKPIPTEVMVDMEQRLEPPNPQKNSWERNSLTLNTRESLTASDIEMVMELISSALRNPLSPVEDNAEQKEADRLKCANNVVHQADQACRRLISESMKNARESHISSEHMRTLAARLNEDKAVFLRDLRERFLQEQTFTQDEDFDVERVVKRAVGTFDVKRKELLLGIINDKKNLIFKQTSS